MQVREELSWLFAGIRDVHCEVVTGGTNLDRERVRLMRKPSVLVGTPGRLLDHLRRGGLDRTCGRGCADDASGGAGGWCRCG